MGCSVIVFDSSKMSLIRQYLCYQLAIPIAVLTGSELVPKFLRDKRPQCNTFREPKIHVLDQTKILRIFTVIRFDAITYMTEVDIRGLVNALLCAIMQKMTFG